MAQGKFKVKNKAPIDIKKRTKTICARKSKYFATKLEYKKLAFGCIKFICRITHFYYIIFRLSSRPHKVEVRRRTENKKNDN